MRRPAGHLLLSLALSAALAACSTNPAQPTHQPPLIATPTTVATPTGATSIVVATPAPTTDLWDRLRNSFAMPGCSADPSVLVWAGRYTRNPKQFEDSLREALPRLDYVQQIAQEHDVPGEFVLLPWVESRYRPVSGHKHHAAGMWQIMPTTARSMGLRVDRHYDARLDIPAAAHAVMKLLQHYHENFHDWRLADYAYNAGEFKIRGLIQRHGMPADKPMIPDLPVNRTTREHLTQLLAIACVIREPGRFQVSLPSLPPSEHLVQIPLRHSMEIAQAANLAGVPEAALRGLNAAFTGNKLDAGRAPYLMLPANHAARFEGGMQASGDTLAGVEPGPAVPQGTHVVSPGESLWQIAREYSTSVLRLEQLNDLPQGQPIRPGQVLKLDDLD